MLPLTVWKCQLQPANSVNRGTRMLHGFHKFSSFAILDSHFKNPPPRLYFQNTPALRIHQLAQHFSSNSISSSNMSSSGGYTVRKNGAPNTLEHRIYIEKDGFPISAFHDIPLYANEQQTVLNMIVEIPRWTNAKLEVSYEWSYGWPSSLVAFLLFWFFFPALPNDYRSRKRNLWTRSNKTLKRVNFAMSAIASLIKAISGTTVHFPR